MRKKKRATMALRDLQSLGLLGSIGLVGLSLTFPMSSSAGSPPNLPSQSFTYQAKFYDNSGTQPLTDTVDLTFDILDANKNCILYEEKQNNFVLSQSGGAVSATVGSVVGSVPPAGVRTSNDPGLTMGAIFSNSNSSPFSGLQSITGSPNCSYTPSSGDGRWLRVTLYYHSTGTSTALTPDLSIGSTPSSLVAQNAQLFQGLSVSDFQAMFAQLNDNNSLQNLGTGGIQSGAIGIGTAPTVGSMNLEFSGSLPGTIQVDRNSSGAPGSQLNINAGGATLGGTDLAGGSLVLSSGTSTGAGGSQIVFQTASPSSSGTSDNPASPKMIITSQGNVGIGTLSPGATLDVAGTIHLSQYLGLGNYTSMTEPTLTASLGQANQGATWFNSTLGQVRYWNGSSAQSVGSGSGGGIGSLSTVISGTAPAFSGSGGNYILNIPMASSANVTAGLLSNSDYATFSSALNLAGGTMTGLLVLSGDPTANLGAATKEFVINQVTNATSTILSQTITSFDGRTGPVTLGLSDITSALGFTPISQAITSFDGQTTGAIVLQTSDVTSALGFTPVSMAGDTGIGSLALAPSSTFELGTYSDPSTLASSLSSGNQGTLWYNTTSNLIQYWDGSTIQSLSSAGSGIISLNGLTSNTQVFATGTAGASPAFVSVSNTHTLNIPMASSSGVTAGLLSNSDYQNFSTIQYVNNTVASGTTSAVNTAVSTALSQAVTSFNGRSGAVTLTLADITNTLSYTPLNQAGDSMTGYLLLNADPVSPLGAATMEYVQSTVGTGTASAVSLALSQAVTSFNGRNGAVSLSPSDVTGAIGFTPINRAGDTGIGSLALAAGNTLGLGTYSNSALGTLTPTLTSANDGYTWYNSTQNQIQYWDGSQVQSLGLSGSGLQSLNGLTANAQYFAIGTSGTGPAFLSSGSTHTLSIPMASINLVTAGLISNADWNTFNGKQAALGYTPLNRAGDTETGSLSVLGTLTANGGLTVPSGENLTLSPGSSLSSSGTATFGSLSSLGAVNLGSTLGVTGVANVGSLTTTGSSSVGSLSSSGPITGTSLSISGNASMGTLSTTGSAIVGSLNSSGTITGTTLSGTTLTSSGAINGNTLNITGLATVGTLTTTGTASVGSLSSSGTEIFTGSSFTVASSSTSYDQIQFIANNRTWDIGVGNNSAGFGVAGKFYVYDSQANSMRFVIDTTGNVGISSIIPGAKLDVEGGSILAGGGLTIPSGQTLTLASGSNLSSAGTNAIFGSLSTTGPTNVGTTLAVTGAANVGSLNSSGSIATTGSGSFGTLTATSLTTSGGIVANGPISAVGSLTVSAGQNLDVTGATVLGLTDAEVTSALGYIPVNQAGDSMLGILSLSGPPNNPLDAATKAYVDNAVNAISGAGYVPLAGGTMTGSLQIANGAGVTSLSTSGNIITAGNLNVTGAGTYTGTSQFNNSVTISKNGGYFELGTGTAMGIGTNPEASLQISGTYTSQYESNSSADILISSATTPSWPLRISFSGNYASTDSGLQVAGGSTSYTTLTLTNVSSGTLSSAIFLNPAGDSYFQKSVSIGTSSSLGTSPNFVPLYVAGTATYSSASYGYYNQSGTGSTSSGNMGPSIVATGNIVGLGFAATSDRRVKEEIHPISDESALKFIHESKPVHFKWTINDKTYNYGFIAQDLLKLGLDEVITLIPDPNVQETVDSDGFVSPAGYRFTVNYNQLTALLTQAMKKVFSRLGWVDREIAALKSKDTDKDQRIHKLEEQNAQLQNDNKAMKAYLCGRDPSAGFCP